MLIRRVRISNILPMTCNMSEKVQDRYIIGLRLKSISMHCME